MTYLFSNTSSIFQSNGSAITAVNPLPVTLGSANINIIGNISVPTTVNVASSPENPVHVHVSEVGTSGNIQVPYMPIGGNVVITSLPNVNATIINNVTVSSITSNVNINPITGNVSVTQGSTPWHVDGNVTATISGNINTVPVGGASTVTAFGEPYGITITPVIQLDSIYGITNEVIQTYTSNTAGAAADANTAIYTVSTGTQAGGYGVLRSKRFLRYRPGQGALARFTASFTPNVAATSQRAGLFNQENAIMVGWNPDAGAGNTPKFGVLRATGGKVQIVVLTINTAPTGTQTANITLNGTSFTMTISAGTTQDVAVRINYNDGFTGWLTDQVDNTVVFMSSTLGPKNGTYSFSATGTGTLATGSFSTKQLGVAQTEYWTYQDQFNVDKLDGTGPSGMVLHSEYLNVYQINFRWLGVGEIRYAIEDSNTGNMVFFHREHYTNRHTLPHVAQPSFKIGYVAYSLGSTTNVTVTGASLMAAIEGDIRQNELNRSTSSNKTTLAQNIVHHLLTIRNPYVTNGAAGALNGNYVLNAKEIILKNVSVGTQGNDPGIVYLFFEPSSFSANQSYYSQPRDNGMISTVDGTFDTTIDSAICQFVTAINGESQYQLSDFRVTVPPGSWVSFAIKSTAQISRATMALVFSED